MKVYLCGRDNVGWATDDDYFLTRRALPDFVRFVESPDAAEIVHAVNWRALLAISTEVLRTRHVVAHVSHDVRAMLAQPDYLKIAPYVNCWISPSRRAERMLSVLDLPTAHMPYAVDTTVFRPFPEQERHALRARLGLPSTAYLIGSFQRDTEGRDLATPKLVKGPDVFFEIVRKLHASGRAIHVVLAGPRRMWLKRRLTEAGVPFTFIGVERSEVDDLTENTLDQKTVNELYNAVDLYIVASRLEGGPKAVLECAAAGTKVIAPQVGQAPDVLHAAQIFRNLPHAVELVGADIDRQNLAPCVAAGLETAASRQPESFTAQWRAVYSGLDSAAAPKHIRVLPPPQPEGAWRRILKRTLGTPVCFDYVPRRGPWGGGNQFLSALAKGLPALGWRARFGRDGGCRAVLLNAFHSKLVEHGAAPGKRYVHRIDGPTVLIRGKDIELDQETFRINEQVATVTVMQSEWSLIETFRLGFRPINPVLIHNAADPGIFHPAKTHAPTAGRKLKLISTSWSNNPRKGGAIYKWLDENIDWSRYEYTFVGRVSEPLQNIRVIEPVASRLLADILRQHDVYITASDNDPCSNALIEAMACGLPAIYFNRGGHPELVGFGGLGFDRAEEIPAALEAIAEDYEAFRRLAVVPTLGDVARAYTDCFNLALGRP